MQIAAEWQRLIHEVGVDVDKTSVFYAVFLIAACRDLCLLARSIPPLFSI